MKAPGLVALALVLACPRAKASDPIPRLTPMQVRSGHAVAPDTLATTFTCTAASPDTGCAVVSSAFTGLVPVAGSHTIVIPCPSPGASVTLNLTVAGVAPGVANSATVAASVTGSCPNLAAVVPTFTLTPFVVRPGGP